MQPLAAPRLMRMSVWLYSSEYCEAVEAIAMELTDTASSYIKSVTTGSDVTSAFVDADVIVIHDNDVQVRHSSLLPYLLQFTHAACGQCRRSGQDLTPGKFSCMGHNAFKLYSNLHSSTGVYPLQSQ